MEDHTNIATPTKIQQETGIPSGESPPSEIRKRNKLARSLKTISPMSKPPLVNGHQFGYTLPESAMPYKSLTTNNILITDEETKRGSSMWVAAHRREPNSPEKRCLDLLNLYRSQNQLPPLIFSRHLSDIIAFHNKKMVAGQIPLSDLGLKDRVKQVDGIISFAENVGSCIGFDDPVKQLVEGWIQSQPHRKNILGRFNKIGIAIEEGKGNNYFGSLFFAFM